MGYSRMALCFFHHGQFDIVGFPNPTRFGMVNWLQSLTEENPEGLHCRVLPSLV